NDRKRALPPPHGLGVTDLRARGASELAMRPGNNKEFQHGSSEMSLPIITYPREAPRQTRKPVYLALSLSTVLATLWSLPAAGETLEEFYSGKVVSIIVGIPPGGGYDLNARLLARHFGRYIPGKPSVIVQNLPGGAGHLRAVRYLDMTGKKDGTVTTLH